MLKNIFFILLIQTIYFSITFEKLIDKTCDYYDDDFNNYSKDEITNIFMKYPIIIIKNNTELLNIFDNYNDLSNRIIVNKCLEINNKIMDFTGNKQSSYQIENITIEKNDDYNKNNNNRLWQVDDKEKICKIPLFIAEYIILQNMKEKGFDFFENLKFSSKNLYSLIYKENNENIEKNKYLRTRFDEPKTIIKYNSIPLMNNKINHFNEKIYLPLIFSPENNNNKLPTIIIMPDFFYNVIGLNYFTENLIINEYFILYNINNNDIILQLVIELFCIQIYFTSKEL